MADKRNMETTVKEEQIAEQKLKEKNVGIFAPLKKGKNSLKWIDSKWIEKCINGKNWPITIAPPTREDEKLHPLMKAEKNMKNVESFLGPATISSISAGLSSVGLNCHLNTYAKILEYATDLMAQLPDGDFFFLSQGEKRFDADFTFQDGPSGIFRMLDRLFSDANIGILISNYLQCIPRNAEGSFSSSSTDGILTALVSIGGILGTLFSGARINPGELAMVIQRIFSSIDPGVTTMSREIVDAHYLVEPSSEDPTIPRRIGMIKYSINFNIRENRPWFGKKTFECNYKINQTSVIFDSLESLRDMFDTVFPQ